ncbi:dTDP-4-dehydrorhamnose 3,5-epimerase [Hylemonella gracilis]|uniref:dTDP-4-dehydrorhamnose 3,5-epimerase n=1 Tax=Hylemonella gracilis TaxID=80880 RepID=A0A4P6UGM5_9BURK|nr:dTDP-4-dehydrorhamnose 3,5-epimerase [Hylemonella gracilis]QBK04398.1 dTDP-4-dehydrorhamnose 3,5-epimerase [Hylemonella gracilis]
MNVIPTRLPGVLIIEPQVFNDARGFFFESYNDITFSQATGISLHFVQDNHSHSVHGVLRGMHYQIQRPQGKLVRVIKGKVFDVVLDLRRSSPYFGQWTCAELSDANQRQHWIPPGFAHGFLVTGESADVLYKVTDYYAPEYERCVLWNDPALGIDWPLGAVSGDIRLSTKDGQGVTLAQAQTYA